MVKKISFTGAYLSDVPKNVLFNKGRTGCGGTTLVLTNEDDYIVCVPNVNAIKGKVKASKEEFELYKYEVLGFYAGVGEEEVLAYLNRNKDKPHKIMTTYESLERLIGYSSINPATFNLLIDEYHSLLRDYTFRHRGVSNALTNFKKFKSFTFMSATPIFDEEFTLEELKDLPQVIGEWDSIESFNVNLNFCNEGVLTSVVELINRYLVGELEGNVYFFINSVQTILKIINHPELIYQLGEHNCKIIASQSSLHKLPWKLSGLDDENYRRVNFLTSTAFEAVDINDRIGKAVIIADTRHDYSLFDVSTTLVQIAGRLRTSIFRNDIDIYIKNRKEDIELTYEEFKEMLLNEKERINKDIELLKGKSPQFIKKMIKSSYYEPNFLKVDGSHVSFDENFFKYQLWKFKLAYWVFGSKENVSNAFKQDGRFKIVSSNSIIRKEVKPQSDLSQFKQAVEKIIELSNRSPFLTMNYGNVYFGLNEDEINYITQVKQRFPKLIPAINLLGYERMKELRFHTGNIYRDLIKKGDIPERDKIREILNEKALTGQFKTNKEIKIMLETIYRQIGLKKKATANQIEAYFLAKKTKTGYKLGRLTNLKSEEITS